MRRAFFVVHQWSGLLLALYVTVIGVTGSALVFRPEMQKAAFSRYFDVHRPVGTPDVEVGTLLARLLAAYPSYQLSGIDYPTARRGTYLSYLIKGAEFVPVFSDPVTGDVIGQLPRTSWISRLQDLHFDLLAGRRGRFVNGIGAFSLIVLFATGLVIWWPGVARWARALFVDVKRPWPRMIWELHGAVGIWLFALLMLWGVTGVEFAFPRGFRSAVNAVLPLTVTRTPESSAGAGASLGTDDLPTLIARAQSIVPGAKMGRIVMASTPKAAIQILLAYKDHGDLDTSDEVLLSFDRYSGALLERRDEARRVMTAGDSLMKWIGPLHLGSFGGTGVKVLWSALALSFPLLAVTGTIMWWRRVLP
jgi:uncharacterized iron-regulated membrane protein